MAKKTIKEKLFDEPYAFEFFQAVRLLEKIYRNKKAVGGEALPYDEIVRFRSNISLKFPASEIHRLHLVADDISETERAEMVINFMGLIGVSGVLPVHYTELAMDRIRHRDTTLWAFLDIFTHRAASMFFRAWAKYRFPVGYERGSDDFTYFLFDFVGLGSKGLRGRMHIQDEALLPYSGLISQKPHTANALANILGDYFSARSEVVQFFGQWLHLGGDDITKLGKLNSGLGTSAIIGTRVWDQQSKFRIRMGPLSFKKFQSFLPNGTAYKSLTSIVKFISGPEFDFDMQLVLAAKQVPGTILTTRALRKPMLGWTSWLKTKPFKADDEQVVLPLNV